MMRADNTTFPDRMAVYVTKAFLGFDVGDVIYPTGMYRDDLVRRGLVSTQDPISSQKLGNVAPAPAKRGRPRRK